MSSNIRTLNDLNRANDPESRPLNPRNRQQQSSSSWDNFGKNQEKNARDEDFCDALRVNLCPRLTLCSFLSVISMIQISVFVAELCIGGISNTSLLAAESATLMKMGEKDPYSMRYGFELWRFICPIFLHGDVMHLFSNVLAQLMIGSSLEADIGAGKFAALYLLSGFGGILFSICCSDMRSMGASTSVYGLVGAYLAFLILNWSYLKDNPNKRCQIIIFLCLGLFLSFLLGAENVDVLGHLGGFLTGTLIGLFLLPGLGTSPADTRYHKSCKRFSIISSIMVCITFLVLFYTLRTPGQNSASVNALVIADEVGGEATVEEVSGDDNGAGGDEAVNNSEQLAQVGTTSEDVFVFEDVPEDGPI